jgi:hypothetical protein
LIIIRVWLFPLRIKDMWLAGSSDCWNKPQNFRKINTSN